MPHSYSNMEFASFALVHTFSQKTRRTAKSGSGGPLSSKRFSETRRQENPTKVAARNRRYQERKKMEAEASLRAAVMEERRAELAEQRAKAQAAVPIIADLPPPVYAMCWTEFLQGE